MFDKLLSNEGLSLFTNKELDQYCKAASDANGKPLLYEHNDTFIVIGPEAESVAKVTDSVVKNVKLVLWTTVPTPVCIISSIGEAVAKLQLKGFSVAVNQKNLDTKKRYTWFADAIRSF